MPRNPNEEPHRNESIPAPIQQGAANPDLLAALQNFQAGVPMPTPPPAPPLVVPPAPASPAAAASPPRRRRAVAPDPAVRAALVASLIQQGFTVEPGPNVHRWCTVLAQKPGDDRIAVHAQAPAAINLMLQRLWRAGMMVDGVSYSGQFLIAVVRQTEQMTVFNDLIRWLSDYAAASVVIGLPPPPWRLVASLCPVERIRAHDIASNPSVN